MKTTAEQVASLIPPDILQQASKIVVNENGEKNVIKDKYGEDTDRENTITIVYNISLEAALASFEYSNKISKLGSTKLEL